jgi:hypothetical protein
MTDQDTAHRLGHTCQSNEISLARFEHYLEIEEQ